MDRNAKQKRDARQAYDQRRQNIDSLLTELRGKLDRDARLDDLTWASVGSFAHVEELLREINAFLG